MSFNQVIRQTCRENFLFSVLLELTYRCNLNCFFCYNDVAKQGRQLVLEDYRVLLHDLHAMGTMNLGLSGGEPMAHPDFFAIGGLARELGFVVRIKTNGHALSAERLHRVRQEIDPFILEISLHGANPASHDRQTRVPGSFDRLIENLQHAVHSGMRLRLHSTLTRWNEHEIEDMYALADGLGIPIYFDPRITPRDNGDREPLSIAPSSAALARLLQLRSQRARALAPEEPDPEERPSALKKGDKHCGAGSSSLLVDPFGDVYPCVQWRRPLGNVTETPIAELWAGSAVLDSVRSKAAEVARSITALSPAAGKISFCPGLAESLTGEATQLDASSNQMLKIQLRDDQLRERGKAAYRAAANIK